MEKKALEYYKQGYNCTQCILKSTKDILGINEEEVMKLTMGLGFGMYLGETCGAVTGAIMAFGLKNGSDIPNDKTNIRKVYKNIKIFEKEFKKRNKSLNCKELKTEYKVDCTDLIKDSAELLKNMLEAE